MKDGGSSPPASTTFYLNNMKKIVLLLAIVISGMLAQAQTVKESTVTFKHVAEWNKEAGLWVSARPAEIKVIANYKGVAYDVNIDANGIKLIGERKGLIEYERSWEIWTIKGDDDHYYIISWSEELNKLIIESAGTGEALLFY